MSQQNNPSRIGIKNFIVEICCFVFGDDFHEISMCIMTFTPAYYQILLSSPLILSVSYHALSHGLRISASRYLDAAFSSVISLMIVLAVGIRLTLGRHT